MTSSHLAYPGCVRACHTVASEPAALLRQSLQHCCARAYAIDCEAGRVCAIESEACRVYAIDCEACRVCATGSEACTAYAIDCEACRVCVTKPEACRVYAIDCEACRAEEPNLRQCGRACDGAQEAYIYRAFRSQRE